MNINLQFVAVGTGTVDAITATYAPVPLALMDRMMVLFRATGANVTTTPTFNPNDLGAKIIVKKGGVALAVGDITGAGFVGHLVYDATNERWELLNPGASGGGGGSVNSVTDDGNGVVSVDNTDPSNPVIEFNGVNVDGITMSGDGTSGNPLVATGGILKGTTSGTDTYTTTITGVTAYTDGDAYLIRFGNGNTTVCTLNINSLGAIPLFRNNDGELIGGDITDGAEMFCIYNSTANTFQVIGTAPNTLLAYVTNDDSVTITKGQPVYAFSGTGDRLTVKLAYNTTDATSAQTVGLVLSTSIAANQKGLIIVNGLLDNLSTLPTSTFADGDAIYLGATAGTITNVKPSAPNHLVYLGVCTTASNGNAGRMYVRVQNGYEVSELHDLKITAPLLNNQGLFYTTSNDLWENKTVISALSGTKAEFDTACSDGNFVFVGDAVLNPEGWNVIVKSANQDVTNNGTLQDDTDFQFSVVAGGHYMVSLDLTYSGNNSTGDYKCAFAVSSGTINGYGTTQSINTISAVQNLIITAAAASATAGLAFGTETDIDRLVYAKLQFSFTASANATFKYQFANNAAGSGRISRTWKGSILKYKRLD
jgi:hypothetical protein